MSGEFNIFKNLDDLGKTNLLDQLRTLEAANSADLNSSQDVDNDDFDFDKLLNDNTRKNHAKGRNKKEVSVTPEKKSRNNAKSRRSATLRDDSISPTLPLFENLSKKVDNMPVSTRTRRSLNATKINADPVIDGQESISAKNNEPSSSKTTNRGRGRGRKTRGRGKGRNQNTSQNQSNSADQSNSIDLTDYSHNTTFPNEIISAELDQQNAILTIMDRFLQQGRQSGRARVMGARRRYVAEIAARSTQVDFIDLVTSPMPRVEGMIDLVSDTEESTRSARSKNNVQHQCNNNNETTKTLDLDASFDEDNPELNIKVNWKGKPESFRLRKYQKFVDIFKKLAERENINMDNIVFNLNDRIILPDDTPESIDYKVFHFIDGRVLKNTFNSPVAGAPKKRDANKITLKIQSDKWKRPLQIDLLKTDKFRILYIKCAEELKVNHDQLKLSFDGECLELNDTPADLDLEGGEVIDLRIKD